MPRKTSLYVDDECAAIIAARDGSPASTVRNYGRASLLFRELLKRYDTITSRDFPNLSEDEWAILLEAGTDWASSTEVSATHRMAILFEAASIAPADEDFLKKLLQLQMGQRMALLDFVERYWAAKARGEVPPTVPSARVAKKQITGSIRTGERRG